MFFGFVPDIASGQLSAVSCFSFELKCQEDGFSDLTLDQAFI